MLGHLGTHFNMLSTHGPRETGHKLLPNAGLGMIPWWWFCRHEEGKSYRVMKFSIVNSSSSPSGLATYGWCGVPDEGVGDSNAWNYENETEDAMGTQSSWECQKYGLIINAISRASRRRVMCGVSGMGYWWLLELTAPTTRPGCYTCNHKISHSSWTVAV